VAFGLLPRARRPDVFSYFDHEQQVQLVEALSDEQVAHIINGMDPDDRVEFFEDASEDLVDDLLELMRPREREETERLLEYPEESIGRLVTTDYLVLRPNWTVREALAHIRNHGAGAETLQSLYLVDEAGRLLDHIALRQLVLADPRTRCDQLREGHVVSLRAEEDREEAVRVMERYDLPVLPVVDADGRLVGIVTFDDVADVAAEEATEDIHKLGGMEALDTTYFSTSLLKLVRKRGLWLVVLFLGGLLTIGAMGAFEGQIERQAILALFVPLIIASGGNSGSQAATLIIRALAVGELGLGDWLKTLRRELLSGLLLGSALGVTGLIVASIVAWFMQDAAARNPGAALHVGFAIGTAVVGVVVTGVVVGSMLPFLLEKLDLDPATCSTPFVATIVDVAGLLIYFTTVTVILGL
jgi:magnesium transporter